MCLKCFLITWIMMCIISTVRCFSETIHCDGNTINNTDLDSLWLYGTKLFMRSLLDACTWLSSLSQWWEMFCGHISTSIHTYSDSDIYSSASENIIMCLTNTSVLSANQIQHRKRLFSLPRLHCATRYHL